MPPLPNPDDTQSQTLRTFTILQAIREDWGGKLILTCGLDPKGTALAQAANIAGAVCLCLEENPQLCKQALRSGACDFVVNTLDEAVRVMKNEIRKRRPLSVGLQGNLTLILQEMLTRGISPELCTTNPTHKEAIHQFKASGTQIVDLSNPQNNNQQTEDTLDAKALLHTFTEARHWQLSSFPFDTTAALHAFDTRAQAILPADDHLRTTWLHAATRVFQRERPIHRVLWLTTQEEQMLRAEPA